MSYFQIKCLESLKKRLLVSCPDGISLEPMALRLLRNDFPELDDATVAILKEEMIEGHSCWFFPEQVVNAETQLKIGCLAESWLRDPGFFALGALLRQFEAQLAHCRDIETFGAFFDKIQLVQAVSVKIGSSRFRAESAAPASPIAKCADAIAEFVESEGGEAAEARLLEENPHLDAPALAALLSEYQRDAFVRAETSGIPVWRSVAVATENLPEDFGEIITYTVDRLIKLDYRATSKNLEMILSVHYDEEFLDTYNLTEELFRKMVLLHYRGSHSLQWSNSGVLKECGWNRTMPSTKFYEIEGRRQKRKRSTFHDLGVPIGAELTFRKSSSIKCKVADVIGMVKYEGQLLSISALASRLLGSPKNGFEHFIYDGETLWDRRMRLEAEGVADV